jgi:stearoyl-CoA desaturase (delta-9 desaturase)
MKFRIPFDRVHWETSIFLIGTLFLTLTAVPLYLWHYGLDWFQISLFWVMFLCTGFSITLGYHRLFSHLSFKSHWSVRLFTLIFGAAAFENSALMWASEHRRHHKHVDHDDDPYDISKGFFHAHIGWLLFKLKVQPPYDNVADLQRDPLVRWQNRWVQLIAVVVSFVLPTVLGWMWNGASGALGAFLIGGVSRIVFLQHCTFFINSACHTIGNRPYSTRCSARDSWIMALFTFGEGYHNYHHEFQHDYRNGVRRWQFDPTKWTIWVLHKVGLAQNLRRVPSEKILLAQLGETQRRAEASLATVNVHDAAHGLLLRIYEELQTIATKWDEYRSKQIEVTREMLKSLRDELRAVVSDLKTLDLPACSTA